MNTVNFLDNLSVFFRFFFCYFLDLQSNGKIKITKPFNQLLKYVLNLFRFSVINIYSKVAKCRALTALKHSIKIKTLTTNEDIARKYYLHWPLNSHWIQRQWEVDLWRLTKAIKRWSFCCVLTSYNVRLNRFEKTSSSNCTLRWIYYWVLTKAWNRFCDLGFFSCSLSIVV